MDPRHRFGRSGEQIAALHYERDGYRVVARNYRCRAGEIDLVLARDGTVVFAEVKTRATDFFGDPSEAVTPIKQMRLRRLAAAWLDENPCPGLDVRFDVVSIVGRGREARVTRYEDAF